MRLIDADALKEEVNKKKVIGRFNTIMLIDNAPTISDHSVEIAKKSIELGRRVGRAEEKQKLIAELKANIEKMKGGTE